MKRGERLLNSAIVILAAVAVSAMLATGWRLFGLRQELSESRQAASRNEEQATRSILVRTSLPVNRKLQLCNRTNAEVRVIALAASYWAQDGKLKQFNSAEEEWHEWTLGPGETKTMRFEGERGEEWDGSAIFYAAEVQRADGGKSIIAGTSDSLESGCVAVVKE